MDRATGYGDLVLTPQGAGRKQAHFITKAGTFREVPFSYEGAETVRVPAANLEERPERSGRQTERVKLYHAVDDYYRNLDGRKSGEFIPVAEVEASSLELAALLTTHGANHWQSNPLVSPLVEHARSTQIGDYAVTDDKVVHELFANGWHPIGSESSVELERPKTSRVYHALNPSYTSMAWTDPGAFVPVADVETASPEMAFLLTTNAGSSWAHNGGVHALVKDCRSSGVGDLVVTPDSVVHQKIDEGWKVVGHEEEGVQIGVQKHKKPQVRPKL